MTAALWTHADAAAATAGRTASAWAANGVSIDSRTVKPGDLFIAIRGDNSDGHRFVGDALAKGASAAMVTENWSGASGKEPLLVVRDTDAGLARSAARAAAGHRHVAGAGADEAGT